MVSSGKSWEPSSPSVRRRPPAASQSYGTNGEDCPLSSHNEEGYPFPLSHTERRRTNFGGAPWHRHPQNLILGMTLAWVGGVMYLGKLAHAILRTHKETANMMGSSLINYGDQEILQKMYGASASDEDVKRWLESRNNNGASSARNAKYGTSAEANNGNAHSGNAGFKNTGTSQGALRDWSSETKSASNGNYVTTTLTTKDDNFKEWLEYQHKNKQVKYDANGMYGKPQKRTKTFADSRPLAANEQQQLPVVATSDPSISTIDWPVQGLAHTSCTSSNGCSPSNNVTVLVVYGPEYHTHISEMAWNVATGVHAAFQSHIRHHPSSPLHGHIVFGHTVNITFLDVMAADAVIIGSPVYNGNIHPDVQNWINYWHIDADLSNKFGGAFATAGGIHAGADGTIMSILRSMMVFQMMAVGGDSWASPFGAVATMYEDPFGDTQRTSFFDASCYYTQADGRGGENLVHPYFLRKAYGLGERIANVTVAWKNSSYVRWN